MTTETMTVHEGLCEIKIIDSRINDAIMSVVPCTCKKHSAINIDGEAPDKFFEKSKASYQKATDLIKRADAIKRAISQSNASTVISVAGVEMTVAEAIYEMQHGVDNKENLLVKLMSVYNKTKTKIAEENDRNLESKLEAHLRDNFGNKDKADPKAIEEARRVFVENNTFEFIDPIGVAAEIEKLNDEITKFKSSVDSAIQISNSQTKITIEY